jgi:hypothetical protein
VVRASSYAASAFWLAWIILGKFIFLTLFLAVTLDAFERKYEVRACRAQLVARFSCAWLRARHDLRRGTHCCCLQADIKRGVRSQSMAGSVFSRIKKMGQRLKSIAGTVAGSASGHSGAGSSMWGRTIRGAAAASGAGAVPPGASASPRRGNAAAQPDDSGALLPGQLANVSAGSSVRAAAANTQPGPVAEAAQVADEYGLPVWPSGLRIRRLQAGRRQQAGGSTLSRLTQLAGSGCRRNNAAQPQHGSSSAGSSGVSSSCSSYTLQHEQAAAFAVAAVSEALMPCDALPDLLDEGCRRSGAAAGSTGARLREPPGRWGSAAGTACAAEMPARPVAHHGSSAAGGGMLQHASHSVTAHGEDYTWHEFLATVAAINHPTLVREQLQQQQQQLLGQAACSQECSEAPPALGPIAEGFEQPRSRQHAARQQSTAPQQHTPASIRDANAEPGSRERAASARLSLQQPGEEHGRLATLPEEPGSPEVLLHGSSDRGAAAQTSKPALWHGLDDDAADAAAAATEPRGAAPEAAGKPVRAGRPPRDANRRVMLFTESMRSRGECPAPPKSPRFAERASGSRDAAAGYSSADGADDLLGAQPPAHAALPAQALLSGLSVEPAVTAQAIRQRRAAAEAAAAAAAAAANTAGGSD